MEYNGLLMHYVILMMLLAVKSRPTLSAAIPRCNSTLKKVQEHTGTVEFEAKQLLDAYVEFYPGLNSSIPDEVPQTTIVGTNTSERLQDIVTKLVLFQWHLSKVEVYLGELAGNPQPLHDFLTVLKSRLSLYFGQIEGLLKILDPEFLSPTKAAPPELSHDGNFTKKYYGWAVISSLKDLSGNVKIEIEQLVAKNVCDTETAGSKK